MVAGGGAAEGGHFVDVGASPAGAGLFDAAPDELSIPSASANRFRYSVQSSPESVLRVPCDRQLAVNPQWISGGQTTAPLTIILITKTERAFAIEHGSPNLYARLQRAVEIVHTDVNRPSVVSCGTECVKTMSTITEPQQNESDHRSDTRRSRVLGVRRISARAGGDVRPRSVRDSTPMSQLASTPR